MWRHALTRFLLAAVLAAILCSASASAFTSPEYTAFSVEGLREDCEKVTYRAPRQMLHEVNATLKRYEESIDATAEYLIASGIRSDSLDSSSSESTKRTVWILFYRELSEDPNLARYPIVFSRKLDDPEAAVVVDLVDLLSQSGRLSNRTRLDALVLDLTSLEILRNLAQWGLQPYTTSYRSLFRDPKRRWFWESLRQDLNLAITGLKDQKPRILTVFNTDTFPAPSPSLSLEEDEAMSILSFFDEFMEQEVKISVTLQLQLRNFDGAKIEGFGNALGLRLVGEDLEMPLLTSPPYWDGNANLIFTMKQDARSVGLANSLELISYEQDLVFISGESAAEKRLRIPLAGISEGRNGARVTGRVQVALLRHCRDSRQRGTSLVRKRIEFGTGDLPGNSSVLFEHMSAIVKDDHALADGLRENTLRTFQTLGSRTARKWFDLNTSEQRAFVQTLGELELCLASLWDSISLLATDYDLLVWIDRGFLEDGRRRDNRNAKKRAELIQSYIEAEVRRAEGLKKVMTRMTKKESSDEHDLFSVEIRILPITGEGLLHSSQADLN